MQPVIKSAKKVSEQLFARGKPELAAKQRLYCCLLSSKCGWPCENLVKGPGLSQIACLIPDTKQQVPLRFVLEQEEFRCPKGFF